MPIGKRTSKEGRISPPNEIFVISKRHPILPKIATVLPHWITIEILCNCINHYILLCSTDPDVIANLYELLSQVIRKCHTIIITFLYTLFTTRFTYIHVVIPYMICEISKHQSMCVFDAPIWDFTIDKQMISTIVQYWIQ